MPVRDRLSVASCSRNSGNQGVATTAASARARTSASVGEAHLARPPRWTDGTRTDEGKDGGSRKERIHREGGERKKVQPPPARSLVMSSVFHGRGTRLQHLPRRYGRSCVNPAWLAQPPAVTSRGYMYVRVAPPPSWSPSSSVMVDEYHLPSAASVASRLDSTLTPANMLPLLCSTSSPRGRRLSPAPANLQK